MTVLLVLPVQQISDADGNPYAGGRIWTYLPNTTTPKATWVDAQGFGLNTNPIVLDAAGRALIYGDGDYRLVLHDAADNLIWDQTASTVVSSAMEPVVAGDIHNAQILLGIDPTLGAQLANESAARIAGDQAIASQAHTSDVALQTQIDAEGANRAAADSAEQAARIAADANLQTQIDGLVPTTAQMRAGSVTVAGTGDFTLTFSPPFPTDVAQIWVGYPPGFGEPTGGSPANPVSFTHITSYTVSGAAGLLLDNNFTPISGAMRFWALGF